MYGRDPVPSLRVKGAVAQIVYITTSAYRSQASTSSRKKKVLSMRG
jgi:hypothetical protein